MLNLPSPQAVLPLDIVAPAQPTEMLPVAGLPLPGFAGLLAASGGALPIAAGPVDSAAVNPEATETPAIEQDWALVLVPELANLPAEFVPPRAALPGVVPEPAPESGAAAGDMLGRGVAALNVGLPGPWPMRAVASPRLAGLVPAADPGRVQDWQNGVPSAPPLPTAPATAALPADFILRNVTGQPIPFPTADQPPWYDPTQAPPWFDPANPPPPWSDPTRPAPLWHDPTQLPPAWLDPARVPAAWFDAPRPPAMTISALVEARSDPALATSLPAPSPQPVATQPAPLANSPAPAAPVTAPITDKASAPVADPVATPVVATTRAEPALPPAARRGPVAQPPIRAERPRRADFDEQPVLAERTQPALTVPTFTLAAPPPSLATPATAHASAAALPNPSPAAAETNPALTVSSDRLGDVAVRLSGGPDQLQVVMQAQPAAAVLIGADAPRLSQDLAAAGVALAGLSVNGQRADLGGGQRDRQRQSARREDGARIAATRRLATRAALNRPTIDRFA
ncbi:MAG: hypothetical protein B7Y35_04835 [Sphingomonadales bacterium 28-64-96]|nr:MAG: hypothetical protein B7Y35_04835 [Sphingomonadales bacterium 28-64-96]